MNNRMQVFKYKSPVGIIYCLFEGAALIELSIGEKPVYGDGLPENSPLLKGSFKNELDAYFKGDLKDFRQKIKFVSGTAFEQKVWLALRKIPFGETRSYKWIAERTGSPMAVRAVGQALKKNPLPIILPCHRVIASDGSIGGFSCGVDIKKLLLRYEGAPIGR
jgi:methylated-DNA-[protein]-cysteine S-methyltransferase